MNKKDKYSFRFMYVHMLFNNTFVNFYTPANALKPPSMGIIVPVTNLEASDASHTHAPIKSSGSPNLAMGVC